MLLAFLGAIAGSAGCRPRVPTITDPFSDAFERAEIGPSWRDTGGGYQIKTGALAIQGAYNHPLWLLRKLPDNVQIDLDVSSRSAAGDIKVELFGDGESFDPDKGGYVSTGYMFIFGGWHNSLSVICRNNEHDDGRKVARTQPVVELGRTYHWTISRRGGALDWRIDGQPFLAWTDPDPLKGSGHEYFAFNNWESEAYFDNLTIRPLGDAKP